MARGIRLQVSDRRDNTLAVRWGMAAVLVLIVAALAFDTFVRSPEAVPKAADTSAQPASGPGGQPPPVK